MIAMIYLDYELCIIKTVAAPLKTCKPFSPPLEPHPEHLVVSMCCAIAKAIMESGPQKTPNETWKKTLKMSTEELKK